MLKLINKIKELLKIDQIDKHWNEPANIYLFKFNNRNTRKKCKICSKLTIKTLERGQWRRSGALICIVFNLYVFHIFFYCFYCWLWTSNYLLGNVAPNLFKLNNKEPLQFAIVLVSLFATAGSLHAFEEIF